MDCKLYNINGYKVLFLKNHSKNVKVRSVIGTGYIHEEENNLGLNHLAEHYLVNANELCCEKGNCDCITYMNKKGITMNATTGLTYVSYFTSGLHNDLYLMIKYICISTLNKHKISEAVLTQEKKAVMNELLENSNDSSTDLWFIMFDKFYKYYGLKNFFNYKQQLENLKNITIKDVNDFIDKYYNNILFIVSGNFDNEKIHSIFRDYLKEPKNNTKEDKYVDCLSNHSGVYFYENKNIKNTMIITAFNNNSIKNTIYNNILLTILTKYLKMICMKILRGKDNLIYGIDIDSSFDQCGIQIFIILNISNEHSKNVFFKLINILNDSKNHIDDELLTGIKNEMKVWYNSKCENDIIEFYENLYINKIFNDTDDLMLNDISEYKNMYLNVNTIDLQDMFKDIFHIKKMLTLYSSEKSMH